MLSAQKLKAGLEMLRPDVVRPATCTFCNISTRVSGLDQSAAEEEGNYALLRVVP